MIFLSRGRCFVIGVVRTTLSSTSPTSGQHTITPEEGSEAEKSIVPEHLIGFARPLPVTLSVGDEVYVLSPKLTPAYPHNSPEPEKVKITALYLLMGRGLESHDSFPAGVVFGIGGLGGHILKSGTICTQLEEAINLAGISLGAQPIVRVA